MTEGLQSLPFGRTAHEVRRPRREGHQVQLIEDPHHRFGLGGLLEDHARVHRGIAEEQIAQGDDAIGVAENR